MRVNRGFRLSAFNYNGLGVNRSNGDNRASCEELCFDTETPRHVSAAATTLRHRPIETLDANSLCYISGIKLSLRRYPHVFTTFVHRSVCIATFNGIPDAFNNMIETQLLNNRVTDNTPVNVRRCQA